MNNRNRQLLDLAYKLQCMVGIPGVCTGGIGEPAHSNQARHGHGTGIKAHDHWFVSACRECHRELDQSPTLSREERRELWERAYIRTIDELWAQKMLAVVDENARKSVQPVKQKIRSKGFRKSAKKDSPTASPSKQFPRSAG